MNRALQFVALLGVAIVLVVQGIQAFPLQPRQGYSMLVLVLALPSVAIAFALVLPRQLGQILRHPNLLVPLGLIVVFEAALGWLASAAALRNVFTPSKTLEFAKLSFTLSFGYVASIVVAVVYAAWVTSLIVRTVADGNDSLHAGLHGLRYFGRVFLVCLIGWGVLFGALAVGMLVAAASMMVAIFMIGVFALGWNLFTAALLPVALDARLGALAAIRRGFQVSAAGLRKWWLAVVAQLLLLGFATFVHVSFTDTRTDQRGSVTTNYQTKTSWAVSAFWTGGYENDCRWHTALMSAVEAPKLAPVSTLLALLFGILAIGVKLRIVSGVLPPPVTPAVEGPHCPDQAGEANPDDSAR
jgi:hypothetical protein